MSTTQEERDELRRWGNDPHRHEWSNQQAVASGVLRLLDERDEILSSGQYVAANLRHLLAEAEAEVATLMLTLRGMLDDCVSLAEAAMHDANHDGAEYAIEAELAEFRAALAQAQPKGVGMVCDGCKHSLVDNDHGPDQNDLHMREDGTVLWVRCTYCRDCNALVVPSQTVPAQPAEPTAEQAAECRRSPGPCTCGVHKTPLASHVEPGKMIGGCWRCSGCGEIMPEPAILRDTSWRWAGDKWQHRCESNHPQHGHEDACYFGPTEGGAE